MKVGYARVSTKDQTLDLQLDALKKAGCTKIYTETVSGAQAERPVLTKLKNDLRRPTMEEIGSRAAMFDLEGFSGDKLSYLKWLLAQCLGNKAKRTLPTRSRRRSPTMHSPC